MLNGFSFGQFWFLIKSCAHCCISKSERRAEFDQICKKLNFDIFESQEKKVKNILSGGSQAGVGQAAEASSQDGGNYPLTITTPLPPPPFHPSPTSKNKKGNLRRPRYANIHIGSFT